MIPLAPSSVNRMLRHNHEALPAGVAGYAIFICRAPCLDPIRIVAARTRGSGLSGIVCDDTAHNRIVAVSSSWLCNRKLARRIGPRETVLGQRFGYLPVFPPDDRR